NDEKSENHELAILLYKQGIKELEKAGSLIIDSKDERAIDLKNKMNKNLEMARERVEKLQTTLQLDKNDRMLKNASGGRTGATKIQLPSKNFVTPPRV
ncbi:unnamed protein product, partial [Didymodactylos carnosus]